jgi:hypothetical protein
MNDVSLTHELNSVKCKIIYEDGSKMQTKLYFDFHTKIINHHYLRKAKIA